MLAGSYSTSAANYLQTIFRVQSPCNEDGKKKKKLLMYLILRLTVHLKWFQVLFRYLQNQGKLK